MVDCKGSGPNANHHHPSSATSILFVTTTLSGSRIHHHMESPSHRAISDHLRPSADNGRSRRAGGPHQQAPKPAYTETKRHTNSIKVHCSPLRVKAVGADCRSAGDCYLIFIASHVILTHMFLHVSIKLCWIPVLQSAFKLARSQEI